MTEREAAVCSTICLSDEPLAFSTIKKAVGYHQEIVSRILRRLVNHGAVQKVRGKYRRVSQ
jgi:DNA-binding HxlR family transcriptional regulator